MKQFTDGVTLTTKVVAILREAPVNGEDPFDCPIVWTEDLGPNIVTLTARHCMAAWCSTPGPNGMPTGHTYDKANNWFVGQISVGQNNAPLNVNASNANAAAEDTELNNEWANTLIDLSPPPRKNQTEVFTSLGMVGDPGFTHIAWVGFYDSATANFDINEVGLWVPNGTSDPVGNMIPSAGGLDPRGPLMSRKILATTISKTTDFTLEFVWAWMF